MRVLATSPIRIFSPRLALAVLGILGSLAISWGPRNALSQESDPIQKLSLWTRSKGSDWPRMLGVHYDSKNSETGILTQWPKDGLRIVWHEKIGTGYGNGVAALGRWFQFDRHGNVERLSCYEAQTGKFLWKWEASVVYQDAYGYNDGPRSSPIVDGRYVYVYGVAGRIACVDIETGKERWQRNLSNDYSVVPNFFGVGASPLVYNDLLIAMVGGSPKRGFFSGSATINDMPSAKPDGTGMIALDKRTGKEVYRVGNYLASYSAPIIAKMHGEDYCVSLMREGLLIFRAKDGSGERFFPFRATTLESVNAASPVVQENKIFISEAYEIGSAMLEFTGSELKLLWRDEGMRSSQSMRTHWTTPLLHENRLYASSGRNPTDTDIRCIELQGNQPPKTVWSQRNRDRGTGMIVDSHWLWLGENGKLHLLRLGSDTHEVVAEMDLQLKPQPGTKEPILNPPSWAPPVLSHGLLFVRGSDRIICLELIPESN